MGIEYEELRAIVKNKRTGKKYTLSLTLPVKCNKPLKLRDKTKPKILRPDQFECLSIQVLWG